MALRKGLFPRPPWLWINLLMKPYGRALGNRAETQNRRGIARVKAI